MALRQPAAGYSTRRAPARPFAARFATVGTALLGTAVAGIVLAGIAGGAVGLAGLATAGVAAPATAAAAPAAPRQTGAGGADAQPARRAVATLEFTVPVGDLVWLDTRTLVVPDGILQPLFAPPPESRGVGEPLWVPPSPEHEAAALVPCGGPEPDEACRLRQAVAERVLRALHPRPQPLWQPADGSQQALVEVGLRLYRLGADGTPTLESRTPVWRGLAPLSRYLDLRVTVLAAGQFVVARASGRDAGSAPAVVLDRATLAPVGMGPGLHPALFLPDGRLFGWHEPPEPGAAQGTPQPAQPARRASTAGAAATGQAQSGLFRLEAGPEGLVRAVLEQPLWTGSPSLEGHAVSGDLRYLLSNTFSGYVLTDLATAERQQVHRSPFLGPPVRPADGQTIYAMDGRGNLVLFEAATLRESTTVLMWNPGEGGPCRFWFAYGPVAVVGRTVLFLCDPGMDQPMGRATGGVTTGQATLWAFDVARREKRPVLPVEVADAGQWLLGQRLVAASPDGRFVAVRENLHRLSIWRLEL